MAMDYNEFVSTGKELLTDFGTTATLMHLSSAEYNDDKVATVKKYKPIKGLAVRLNYNRSRDNNDVLGQTLDIIEAGDVKVICQFPTEPIVNKDKLLFANITYNIVSKRDINPAGISVLYILQCRKI